LLAQIKVIRVRERRFSVTKKFSVLTLVLLTALAVGCSKTNETASSNANVAAENTTKPGPDNSEITTKVDASGVKTEERVFHGNPRISRVVVTTKNGTKTVKAYSPSGEERDVKSEAGDVLEATGSKVADSAGFVAHKTEDVAGEAKDVGVAAKDKTQTVGEKTAGTAKTVGDKTVEGAKTVGNKTVEGAKTVGDKTVEGAKTVGDKTVEGAKTVGSKTVSGAKKAGSAVKKVIP
jgi:hypothetical protein